VIFSTPRIINTPELNIRAALLNRILIYPKRIKINARKWTATETTKRERGEPTISRKQMIPPTVTRSRVRKRREGTLEGTFHSRIRITEAPNAERCLIVTVNVPVRTHQVTRHETGATIDRIFNQTSNLIMEVHCLIHPTAQTQVDW